MKLKSLTSILLIMATVSISACQSSAPAQVVITPTSTASISVTVTPVIDEKEAILQKINQLIENYNAMIENEKQTGNYEIISAPDGTNGLLFTGKSLYKVYEAEVNVQTELTALNEQYYIVAMQENRILPTPNPLAQNGDPDKLLEEYLAWSDQETKVGSVVWVYGSGDGLYHSVLIGESYVAIMQWQHELSVARAKSNNLSDELIESDILEIQRVEGSAGWVKFTDIGNFPFYRSDIKLSTYETQSSFYILYSQTHQIIEVNPKQLPPASQGTVQELEQRAREIISLVSPEVNLDMLTPAHGEKIGTYFFRWEDRTRPLLDDGRSYPSIQVGLNGDGELLNYYNTLPLAR